MNETAIQFSESQEQDSGTETQLKELTALSKRLKTLREKRDALRVELQGTEAAMRVAVANIARVTAQMADEGQEETSGKKHMNGKSK